MKTPTKPPARMPRASKPLPAVVRWIYLGNDLHTCISPTRLNDGGKEQVCAVIPTATAHQARKLAAFFNMTPEDQHETIVLITEDGNISPNDQATAILAAIT